MPKFLSLKKSPERKTSLLVELKSQNKNRTLSGIFRLFVFLLKSSNPKKYLTSFTTPKYPGSQFLLLLLLFFFWGGWRAFWSENGSRLSLSGMVFEGTTGVYERIYHFCFKCLRKKEKYANLRWILKHLFCCCSKLRTVMIRFSTRGAYLLLVTQGRALISLLRNNRMLKIKL